jgi:hypothetical protein
LGDTIEAVELDIPFNHVDEVVTDIAGVARRRELFELFPHFPSPKVIGNDGKR